MKFWTVLFVTLALFVPGAVHAKHDHPERWYQERWCSKNGGRAEVTLPDKTRCDCETDKHAIEFDFGSKWAEAIGQALYYGLQTGKRPGVVLILERETDRKYWIRLNSTIDHYSLPIKAWAIGPGAVGGREE
jgi:hypothetical protein